MHVLRVGVFEVRYVGAMSLVYGPARRVLR